jgi:hypothetical protein
VFPNQDLMKQVSSLPKLDIILNDIRLQGDHSEKQTNVVKKRNKGNQQLMIMSNKEFNWQLNCQEIDWAKSRISDLDSSEVMGIKKHYNISAKSFLDLKIESDNKKKSMGKLKDSAATTGELIEINEL